jgi:hypothetical protein
MPDCLADLTRDAPAAIETILGVDAILDWARLKICRGQDLEFVVVIRPSVMQM